MAGREHSGSEPQVAPPLPAVQQDVDADALQTTLDLSKGQRLPLPSPRLEPPHPTPMGLGAITIEATQVLETVSWLCERVQDQHGALGRLQRLISDLQKEGREQRAAREQQEELREQRFETIERAVKSRDRLGATAGSLVESRELPAGLIEAEPAFGGASASEQCPQQLSTELNQTIGFLDQDLTDCQNAQGNLERSMKRLEQQQQHREAARDELVQLEFEKIRRDLDTRARRDDVSQLRQHYSSSLGGIEADLKVEVQRLAGELKDSLQQQIIDLQSSLQSSLKRISERTEQQMSLLDEKVTSCGEVAQVSRTRTQPLRAESGGVPADQLAKAGPGGAAPPSRTDMPTGAEVLQEPASEARHELPLQFERLEQNVSRIMAELGLGQREGGSSLGDNAIEPARSQSQQSTSGQRLPARIEKLEALHEELTAAVAGNRKLRLDAIEVRLGELSAARELTDAMLKQVALSSGFQPEDLEAAARSAELPGQAGGLSPGVTGSRPVPAGAASLGARRGKRLDKVGGSSTASEGELLVQPSAAPLAVGGGAQGDSACLVGSQPLGAAALDRVANGSAVLPVVLETSGGETDELSRAVVGEADLNVGLKRLPANPTEVRPEAQAGRGASQQSPRAAAGADARVELLAQSAEAQRAEAAAAAAEASAAAVKKLHRQMQDMMESVETPILRPRTAAVVGPTGVVTPGMPCTSRLRDDLEDDSRETLDERAVSTVQEYVERQVQVESRLHELEEQLETVAGSKPPSGSEIVQGLKLVVKDVRRCMQRCELLMQLPEVKIFVKRFYHSLQVNAVLQEKWLGPDAVRSPLPAAVNREQVLSRGGGDRGAERLSGLRPGDRASSAPDLVPLGRVRQDAQYHRCSKRSDGKKKPFRTVVDWARPHTPLTINPTYKPGVGGSGGEDSFASLPQIERL